MTQHKLRVGIIGIGMIAVRKHIPHLRATGRAEVVAISRRTAAALEQAQTTLDVPHAFTDWHDMLDTVDLDAVVVSTAHHAHAGPTLAALERGLHVLVEKPMALTAADAWAMVDAAEQHDRILMVGYNLRCAGLWRAVKRALDQGLIGTVRLINLAVAYNLTWFWDSSTIAPYMQERLDAFNMQTFLSADQLSSYWRRDPAAMGGGMFADAGSHWVDLALWLGGAPPTEVIALTESAGLVGGTSGTSSTAGTGMPTGNAVADSADPVADTGSTTPVDRFVSVQARLRNDVLLSLTSADGIAEPLSRLTLYGDRGTLTADWNEETQVWVHRDAHKERLLADLPDTTPAAAFVDTILTRRQRPGEHAPNLAPASDGAYAVAFAEAAYRSARQARIVRPDIPQQRGQGQRSNTNSPKRSSPDSREDR